MSEKRPGQEQCASCPNRSAASKMLARIIGKNQPAEGCLGPVEVSHGKIVTQVRTGDEPAPDRKTWNSLTGPAKSGGERRYSRIDWTSETVCGRDTIEPAEGEVAYYSGDLVQTDSEDKRVAAFIKGSSQDISDQRVVFGMVKLLNSASQMQVAEAENDAAGAADAQSNIESNGFSLIATAGRNDGLKKSNE